MVRVGLYIVRVAVAFQFDPPPDHLNIPYGVLDIRGTLRATGLHRLCHCASHEYTQQTVVRGGLHIVHVAVAFQLDHPPVRLNVPHGVLDVRGTLRVTGSNRMGRDANLQGRGALGTRLEPTAASDARSREYPVVSTAEAGSKLPDI
jgi:hypothetical protein